MEAFTAVDAGVALVIVLSAILAYSRGFVREGMAILGWIAAAVVAYMFAPKAVPLVKQIPYLDEFLGTSCELALIAGFAVVFAGALILVSLFTPLFSSIVQRSALGGIDQGLGFLFGVARGVLLVAVAFLVYDRVMTAEGVPMVDNSQSAKVFEALSVKLSAQLPADAPGWIAQRYQGLVGSCGAPVETDGGTLPLSGDAPVAAPEAPATSETPAAPAAPSN